MHYDVHGGRGPFILFVHGLLSSRAQWRPNLGAFLPHYRPVVVELLGHGRSPSPDDPARYTPLGYVEAFERIRSEVGAERWYIVGQSLGASLTLRYALDHPRRVIAQVFTNSSSALADDGFAARVRPVMEGQAEALGRLGRAALERHPLNPGRARSLAPELKAALVADFALHEPRGIALTGLHTIPAVSVRERIGENSAPTLPIVGEREERFRQFRRYAEAAFPDLTVQPVDAGHAVNLERPAEFNAAVLAFFAEHPA